jgi:hypothetical protein
MRDRVRLFDSYLFLLKLNARTAQQDALRKDLVSTWQTLTAREAELTEKLHREQLEREAAEHRNLALQQELAALRAQVGSKAAPAEDSAQQSTPPVASDVTGMPLTTAPTGVADAAAPMDLVSVLSAFEAAGVPLLVLPILEASGCPP